MDNYCIAYLFPLNSLGLEDWATVRLLLQISFSRTAFVMLSRLLVRIAGRPMVSIAAIGLKQQGSYFYY